jgi:hypothetical protein
MHEGWENNFNFCSIVLEVLNIQSNGYMNDEEAFTKDSQVKLGLAKADGDGT